MKVLVNVARELLNEKWHGCEGVRLREEHDGSFALDVTGDLVLSQREDAKAAELLDFFHRLSGTRDEA